MAQKQILYFLRSVRTCAPLPVTSRLCSSKTTRADPPAVLLENESLLQNLSSMGVDLASARRRHPGVLRKLLTNERGLARFLSSKGADSEAIASIITRFPRSITRTSEHLEERWKLWRNIFKTDGKVVEILSRSPESFFRSSDNKNLKENIAFLMSLGITSRDLHRLLTTAPRTFSNSVALNRTMVEFLQGVCVSLGGTNPKQFALTIITKNLYVFIRSTNRINANIRFLQSELRLSKHEALVFFQGHGAHILDLSHESLKKNFRSLRDKLRSLGCSEEDFRRMILKLCVILFNSAEHLSRKLDCLTAGGVHIQQIIGTPKVLESSMDTLQQRLDALNGLGYSFQENGITVLDMSKKRFQEKLERLQGSAEE